MYWGHCAEWISQTEKGICGNLYILSSPYIRGRFVLGAGRYTRIHGYSNLIEGTLNPWVLHPWIQPDLDENFNPYLVESEDAKHVNMEGWLYIYWKKKYLCVSGPVQQLNLVLFVGLLYVNKRANKTKLMDGDLIGDCQNWMLEDERK